MLLRNGVAVTENVFMGHFGAAVKRLRNQRRLGQDKLAQLAKLSRSEIQTVEKSPRSKMRPPNYVALAEALGMSADELDAEWTGPNEKLLVELTPDVLKSLRQVAGRKPIEVVAVELLQKVLASDPPSKAAPRRKLRYAIDNPEDVREL